METEQTILEVEQKQKNHFTKLEKEIGDLRKMHYLSYIPDAKMRKIFLQWFWSFINCSGRLAEGSSYFTNRPPEAENAYKHTVYATYGIYRIEVSVYEFSELKSLIRIWIEGQTTPILVMTDKLIHHSKMLYLIEYKGFNFRHFSKHFIPGVIDEIRRASVE